LHRDPHDGSSLPLAGIPHEVFRYRLGNRSALDWVIDQYQGDEAVRGDKAGLRPSNFTPSWGRFSAEIRRSKGVKFHGLSKPGPARHYRLAWWLAFNPV